MLQDMLFNPVTVGVSVPEINIRKNDKEFQVVLAVPGYDASQLEMAWEDKVLDIKGRHEAKDNENDDNWYYLRREIKTPGFHYRVQLPEATDESSIVAELKDGLLTIRVPMLAKKTIPIKIESKNTISLAEGE
ncbi:MAG: Hsp20/alpha crystallin family protein [Sulfobacillus benefaciens]|jgi:HSP20 family protein|uniref:Hsp20/alpha crystallin family protein n=1 Tax=Sulfobacillus benefaciens TaxID=453960 RepID=A0A2T2XLN4_9FIRM|nr:MAG: Hsp20/alpha crystallin family protein [Sulfobacillus benefaciens]